MDKLFSFLSDENKFFDPRDSLSQLVKETLNGAGLNSDELDEEDLFQVQAARGSAPADTDTTKKAGRELWKKTFGQQ